MVARKEEWYDYYELKSIFAVNTLLMFQMTRIVSRPFIIVACFYFENGKKQP